MSAVFDFLGPVAILTIMVSVPVFAIRLIRKKSVKKCGIVVVAAFATFWISLIGGVIFSCDGTDVEISRTEATCTKAGEIVYKCDKCGEITKKTIEPTGHTMEEVSRTEPTEESEGQVVSRCKVCGKEETETLDKLKPKKEDKKKEKKEDKAEAIDTSVTYDEIYREFKRNELNAKDIYNGNRYQITAKINGMSTSGLLNLTGGATLTMEYQVDNTIVFFLAEFEKDQEEALKKISVGDTITFTGICYDGTFIECEMQ